MENIFNYLVDNIPLHSIEKKLRYCEFAHKDFIYNDIILDTDQRYKFKWYLEKYFNLNNIRKENNSYYAKRRRLKKRIKKMLDSGLDCYFITLTFDNETLLKTKDKIRRKYVQKFLKSQCADYVANIDYGIHKYFDLYGNKYISKGREHYHGVVCGNDLINWPYGFKKYELINVNNEMALSSYITKLSSHAIKDSTKNRNYLIYARQKN